MTRTLLAFLLVIGLAGPAWAVDAVGIDESAQSAAISGPSEARTAAREAWPWRRGMTWMAPRADQVIKPFRVSLAAKAYFLPADVFFVGSQSAARALGLKRALGALQSLRPNGNDLGLGILAGLVWAVVLRFLPNLLGSLYSFTKQLAWVLFRLGKAPQDRRSV